MTKATKLIDLMRHDFKEGNAIYARYWSSSSLPPAERRKHRPKVRKYPRDRVMNRLTSLYLAVVGARLRGER